MAIVDRFRRQIPASSEVEKLTLWPSMTGFFSVEIAGVSVVYFQRRFFYSLRVKIIMAGRKKILQKNFRSWIIQNVLESRGSRETSITLHLELF